MSLIRKTGIGSPDVTAELEDLQVKTEILQALVQDVNDNLRLLNARFEEAFNTGINKEDLA